MRLLVRQKSETGSRNRHLQAESNFDNVDRKDNVHGQSAGTRQTTILKN